MDPGHRGGGRLSVWCHTWFDWYLALELLVLLVVMTGTLVRLLR